MDQVWSPHCGSLSSISEKLKCKGSQKDVKFILVFTHGADMLIQQKLLFLF